MTKGQTVCAELSVAIMTLNPAGRSPCCSPVEDNISFSSRYSLNVAMKGLMQDWPLVVNSVLDYAAKFHGEQEIITCTVEGPVHRYTYADMHRRSQSCALAMKKLGVG